MKSSSNFMSSFFYALLLAPGAQRVKECWQFLFFFLFVSQLGSFTYGSQGQSIQWVLFL